MAASYRYYTQTELDKARALAEAGKSQREIGLELGRTRRSVEWACRNYGIKTHGNAGTGSPAKERWKRPYTEAEKNKLIRWAPHHSISELAILLGRTAGSVSGTCAYYNIKTGGGPGGSPSHRSKK